MLRTVTNSLQELLGELLVGEPVGDGPVAVHALHDDHELRNRVLAHAHIADDAQLLPLPIHFAQVRKHNRRVVQALQVLKSTTTILKVSREQNGLRVLARTMVVDESVRKAGATVAQPSHFRKV